MAFPCFPHRPELTDRRRRTQLSEQNAATYERIASLSQTATSLERQNDEILTHFTQVSPPPRRLGKLAFWVALGVDLLLCSRSGL